MELIEIPQPEIPEEGWFRNVAARIIAGEDRELEEILISSFKRV